MKAVGRLPRNQGQGQCWKKGDWKSVPQAYPQKANLASSVSIKQRGKMKFQEII